MEGIAAELADDIIEGISSRGLKVYSSNSEVSRRSSEGLCEDMVRQLFLVDSVITRSCACPVPGSLITRDDADTERCRKSGRRA